MKFFPYPINSENLAEFTRPGSTLFGHVVTGEFQSEAVHLAGNGFVAVLDHLGIESLSITARQFPAASKKLLGLPWHHFDNREDSAQYRNESMNRKVNCWVELDDHSLNFAQHRNRDLFKPDGQADLFGYFACGHGRVAVPPQVLNLVRKLPRARFWVPRINFHGRQDFLPVKFNGGLCLIGNLPEQTAERLPELGSICAAKGSNPMSLL